MRFGNWRVMPLAMTVAAVLGMGLVAQVRADGWLHSTLPGEVPAYDYTTGGEYFAPPVPYGHYAKDPHGQAAKALGHLYGPLGALKGLFHHDGCGSGCGDKHGHGDGNGCGHGLGGGCGFCSGKGLFHGHGDPCGTKSGCGLSGLLGHGSGKGLGHGHKKHFAPCHATTVVATAQSQPSAQAVVAPSGQSPCGSPGCGIGGIHSHLANLKNKLACKFCGGRGLGKGGPCGGCGGLGLGDPCGRCGGSGVGHGKSCGGCGGCGLGHGCGLCGGKGCGACLKGLAGKAHGLLGSALGMFHHNKVDYFVGPGGPVPLTPGYVPYIVTTRSPRDFFSFPPMNPNDP